MKMPKKPILHSAAFLLILALLLTAAGYLVRPRDNRESAGMPQMRANGFLAEKENTLDVLVIGDSESFSAISPMLMWEEYGFTAYVCGTVGQYLNESYQYLRNAFESQSPKVVLLETNAIYRDSSLSNYLFAKGELLFPVFRYHDRWKSMRPGDLLRKVKYTHIEDCKGFQIADITEPAPAQEHMIPSDEAEEIPVLNRINLWEIQSLCESHGAVLVLVSVPSRLNWNYERHNGIAAYAGEHGISYLDLNLEEEAVPIDWAADTRDAGDHMNYSGAVKVTDYLGAYLKKTYALPDHREESGYEGWRESMEHYRMAVGE